MRIGFDVSPLHRPHPPGVVRATRGLVEALERRARIEIVRLVPPPRIGLARWRQWTVPGLTRALQLDGVHSCVSAFPLLGRGARVQTIHETPWFTNVAENADFRHRAWAAIGPLRADRVIVPSEATGRGVRASSPPSADKVRVCAWGLDDVFTPRASASDDHARERRGLADVPYVVCAGAVRAKKNLAAVIRGVAHHRRASSARIVIAVTGERTPELMRDLVLAEELGLARDVRTLGVVDDAELAALLRGAIAAPVLSHSEGFGFPVLEAQACGTPAIVPRGSAQAEVAGEAAFFVDASEPATVSAALESARQLARGTPRAPHRASIENAARFTWDACAERVEAAWSEIAAKERA
jgi:glycosyltransferase involved in cell wall biosynthesis